MPIVVNSIPNQTLVLPARTYSFTFSIDTFEDVDIDDALKYSSTLSNGNPLPSWLTFHSQTRNFSGTPTNDDIGTYTIKAIAEDLSGASVADEFLLKILDPNDAPKIIKDIPNQTISKGSAFKQIELDNFIADANNSITEIAWTTSGQN